MLKLTFFTTSHTTLDKEVNAWAKLTLCRNPGDLFHHHGILPPLPAVDPPPLPLLVCATVPSSHSPALSLILHPSAPCSARGLSDQSSRTPDRKERKANSAGKKRRRSPSPPSTPAESRKKGGKKGYALLFLRNDTTKRVKKQMNTKWQTITGKHTEIYILFLSLQCLYSQNKAASDF